MRGLDTGLRDGVEVAEFFHHRLRLGRLGARDVEGARFAGLQLRWFSRQGARCRLRCARPLSVLLDAISMTRMATGSWLMRCQKAGLGPVSPLNAYPPVWPCTCTGVLRRDDTVSSIRGRAATWSM
ncbi:hypothetical protein [Acidovorax sp.]|uniref:hypothetical protein n=1 Tax=Acidovorax sp. TaxID=1872122 RepID=UPI002582E3A7|nr:hypothetical protein [Acidovorax sp.]